MAEKRNLIQQDFLYQKQRWIVKGPSSTKDDHWLVESTSARLDDPNRFMELPHDKVVELVANKKADASLSSTRYSRVIVRF
jgi:hypothetical protein